MDSVKAQLLFDSLVGQELEGWHIEKLIDHGKSAAVFLGTKDGSLAAVKIFDTELIERYGDKAQVARIERELELRGSQHENLVSIYGGGYDESRNIYYIIMGYVDGENLKKYLPNVKEDIIPSYVSQLASAAKFLEDKGLCHRDIKPENIAITDGGEKLVLLDLGVVRPVSGSDLTDPEGIQAFVGTLQYSSPEFLLREEKQDVDGFRALTFYQIGAVLHDLITKKPIFDQFANPYAKLVNAVQHEQPALGGAIAPIWLIQLAQRCLLKSPTTRLKMVTWDSFFGPPATHQLASKERVEERLATVRAQSDDLAAGFASSGQTQKKLIENIVGQLKLAATSARGSVTGLPPLSKSKCDGIANAFDLAFQQKADSGFPHGFVIRIIVEVIDPSENVISCSGCGFFPGNESNYSDPASLSHPWFQGVLENVALHSAFEDFFFAAIDWCLEVSPGVEPAFTGAFCIESEVQKA